MKFYNVQEVSTSFSDFMYKLEADEENCVVTISQDGIRIDWPSEDDARGYNIPLPMVGSTGDYIRGFLVDSEFDSESLGLMLDRLASVTKIEYL